MTSKSRLGGLTVISLAFKEYTNVLSWSNRRYQPITYCQPPCLLSRNPLFHPAYQWQPSSFNKYVQSTNSEPGTVLWPEAGGEQNRPGGPALVNFCSHRLLSLFCSCSKTCQRAWWKLLVFHHIFSILFIQKYVFPKLLKLGGAMWIVLGNRHK